MSQNCPNCGASVPELLSVARVQACDYCGTTLVQEDNVFKNAGSAGDMFDAPSLFELGQTASIGTRRFTPLGKVRYDYGRGTWDEFWGEDEKGNPVWVSVDEGDVAWQEPFEPNHLDSKVFRLGAQMQVDGVSYVTTEVNNATCVGFRGQLPEAPEIGEIHLFANFSGPDGQIVSGERWDEGAAWFKGHWIDPFKVQTT